ncbi:MAG: heparinase II/III-family protein [Methylobacterium frigidaeris]
MFHFRIAPGTRRGRLRLVGTLARLRWYAGRLRAMSAAEILHRVGEARRRRRWRGTAAAWGPDGEGARDPLPAFADLRRCLAAAAGLPAVRDGVARAREGRLRFLGRDWPGTRFGEAEAAFWRHDPVGGGAWPGPGTSSFRVDVRSTTDTPGVDGGFGDVKYVWEPARLQVLHPLACALAAGDGGAGETALAMLRSFAAANPPYGGVHWVSGIELTMRLVSVLLLVAAAGPEGLPPDDRALVRRLAEASAHHLAEFPSLHSSANNHRVAEGLGLFLAGLLLAARGAAFEAAGRTVLEREAERQILPDGVGAEQSPTYQAFTMEMLALAVRLGRDLGRPLADPVGDRLARGAAFLGALMDGTGRVPAIGDDDEGRVLAQPPDREPRYVASVTAAVAGLTGRPDLAPPARDPHLRDALLGAAAPAGDRPEGVAVFRDGGYTTARETVAGRRAVLAFDHGPLGYLTLAAHGHADALAIWLTIDGEPVLIDAGTYLYHSGRSRRTALRESPAHNTLVVAGASQSVASAGFSWASRADAALVAEETGPLWSVTGEHRGYARRFGTPHRRRLARRPEGYLVADSLPGAGTPLPVEIRFLLPPGLSLAGDGDGVVAAGAGPLCRLVAPPGFGTSILAGEAGGPVHSAGFGHLAPAQAVVFTGRLGRSEVLTRLDILPRP